MLLRIFALSIFIFSLSVGACPNLSGTYICEKGEFGTGQGVFKLGDSKIEITQEEVNQIVHYYLNKVPYLNTDGKMYKVSGPVDGFLYLGFQMNYCDGDFVKSSIDIEIFKGKKSIGTSRVFKVYSLDDGGDLKIQTSAMNTFIKMRESKSSYDRRESFCKRM